MAKTRQDSVPLRRVFHPALLAAAAVVVILQGFMGCSHWGGAPDVTPEARLRSVPGVPAPLTEVVQSARPRFVNLPFHPRWALEIPTFSGTVPDAPCNTQATPERLPDPPAGAIDGVAITASDFVDATFQRHHEWFLHQLREILVTEIARREVAREGIRFTPEEIDTAHEQVMAFLRQRAARENIHWSRHLSEQGFESNEAYSRAWREYHVPRLMALEHLVFLMDVRLDKVRYSRIVIPDRDDMYDGDPQGYAARLAARIRSGDLTWQSALLSSHEPNPEPSVVVRGSSGLPNLEEWLFSHEEGDISDPIPHELWGYIIARIDTVTPGQPAISWEAARPEIERRLGSMFDVPVPGSRVTDRDTFVWLERVLLREENRFTVRTYAPRPDDGRPIVGTVDGDPITAGDFLQHSFLEHPEWAKQVLAEAIAFKVADLEAAREGVELTESEISVATDEIVAKLRENLREEWDEHLRLQGFTSEGDFIAMIRELTRQVLLVERLVYFHDRRVPRVDLWHILLDSEEEARRVRERIEADTSPDRTNFEVVAARFSQHRSTRERNGFVGTVARGTFADDFEDVVFSLLVNEVSQPFETENGWHIVRVTHRYAARELPYAMLEDEIETALSETGGLPGHRITTADVLRWLAAIKESERYVLEVFYPRPVDELPPTPIPVERPAAAADTDTPDDD